MLIDKRLKIEKIIEDKEFPEDFRPHLGGSQIGRPCPREIWYSFRWATTRTTKARQKRLFSRGWREEPIILEDLANAGVKILSTQETLSYCNGHAGGSSDGKIIGVPDAPKTVHLLEIKTANLKNFNNLIRLKSVQAWKSGYYDQCQIYMDKLKLKRGLFIVACKDDDRRYYERIKFDKKRANILTEKADTIIYSPLPMPGVQEDALKYPCIFCDHQELCHYHGAPAKNCRTCTHSAPSDDGKWICRKKEKNISLKKQRKACKNYRPLI